MGGIKSTCLVAFAVVTLTAACTSEPELTATPPGTSAAPAAAASAGRVGGADSACKLPLSFDLADKWKPKAIEDAESLGSLGNQGGFTAACEIDAKPAGHLGFLRIWTSTKTGSARAALDDFLAADRHITVPEHSEAQVASTTAAEVTYIRDNPNAEVKKRERLLSVPTPSGAVVLALGGFDDDEHTNMLPAYELAKKSLRIP
ncbi:lipoprotein [Kibdelosporangium aridum]|uniref:lipoprotein n=1 Tax=Kibdelosporangium aridum TaxID=2030 RepID=UPI0035E9323E